MILALLACLNDFPDRDQDFDGDGIPVGEDCDDTDASIGVASFWYIDADGDEHGGDKTITTCHPQSNAVKSGGDCDDTDAANFVDNVEVCDQGDNDCDDEIDEGVPILPETLDDCGDGIDDNCDGSCGDCCFEGDNVVTAAPFALFSTKDMGSLGRTIVATDLTTTGALFAVGSPREEAVFLVPTLDEKASRIDVDDPKSLARLGVAHGAEDSYFGTALAAIDEGGILVGAPGAEEVLGKTVTNGAVYRIDGPITAGSDLTVDESDVALYATGGKDPTYFGSAILPGANFTLDESPTPPDVVVSGVDEAFEGGSFSTGAVWVFYDSLSGSPSSTDVITGSDLLGGFGASIAAGDLNGDGADDLLIGESAPDVATSAEVYIFLGSKDPFGSITDADADFSFTSLPAGANLGASLALGDFDDSGSIDIAAGAPNPGVVGTTNATVHVYLNDDDWWEIDKTGQLRDIFLDQDDLTFVGTENDRTGTSLVAKDLDLDGFDDLLIGSPGVQGGGRAYLVRMPMTGSIGPDDLASAWSVGSGAPDELGFALSAGNFSNDAWPDVLLAAPGDRTVYVWTSAGL